MKEIKIHKARVYNSSLIDLGGCRSWADFRINFGDFVSRKSSFFSMFPYEFFVLCLIDKKILSPVT